MSDKSNTPVTNSTPDPVTITSTSSTPVTPVVSTVSTSSGHLSIEQISKLKSFSLWLKIYAVFTWVGSVSLFLTGIAYLIFIIGIFILPLAVLTVFLGIKLWKASESADKIILENTSENYNKQSFDIISQIEWYFKAQGILQIVGMVFAFVAMIFAIIFFGAIMSQFSGVFEELNTEMKQSQEMRGFESEYKVDWDKDY